MLGQAGDAATSLRKMKLAGTSQVSCSTRLGDFGEGEWCSAHVDALVPKSMISRYFDCQRTSGDDAVRILGKRLNVSVKAIARVRTTSAEEER